MYYKKLFFLLIFISFLSSSVFADLGPKPSATFYLQNQPSKITKNNLYTKMLFCTNNKNFKYSDYILPVFDVKLVNKKNNCYWVPFKFAFNFGCENNKCVFHYAPPVFFRIMFYFKDINKIYISKPINRNNFNAFFNVNFDENDLIIKEINKKENNKNNYNYLLDFFLAFIITIFVELIVAFFYILYKKKTKKLLIFILLANIISLPLIWFIFKPLLINWFYFLIVAEVFAIVFEFIFIYFFTKKYFSVLEILLLVIIMNVLSFIIGNLFLLI